jgi:hypothetical protein
MNRSRRKNQKSFAGRAAISFVINNGINPSPEFSVDHQSCFI